VTFEFKSEICIYMHLHGYSLLQKSSIHNLKLALVTKGSEYVIIAVSSRQCADRIC